MEKHGGGVEQAGRMLTTFASLGVQTIDLTETNLDGHKVSFRTGLSCDLLRRWIPSLLEAAHKQRRNVIVRPRGAPVKMIQLDDLSGAMIERVRRSAFLILITSAANHQAWVAVAECSSDWSRRLRQGSSADPSASGATRMAGSVNFKRKYAPDFPAVQLLEAVPNRITSQAELEALGLVAAPSAPAHRNSPPWRTKQWPSYERCLQNAPPAHNSNRPDISRADFTFCLLALDWGWSVAETCQRLLEQSRKADLRGEAYARLTVERAAAAVARRRSLP